MEAVEAAGRMRRACVRAAFYARFTARRMAEDYVRLYERMLDTETTALFGKAMLVAG